MDQTPPRVPDDAMNATATYVCTTDPTRTRTYPFREGRQIPRQIDEHGETFVLRVVQYEPMPGIEITRAVA